VVTIDIQPVVGHDVGVRGEPFGVPEVDGGHPRGQGEPDPLPGVAPDYKVFGQVGEGDLGERVNPAENAGHREVWRHGGGGGLCGGGGLGAGHPGLGDVDRVPVQRHLQRVDRIDKFRVVLIQNK
jgi:hypothetical protein